MRNANQLTDADYAALTEMMKRAIDAAASFEALPVHCVKTRNGWAAYKGTIRITKYFFSEEGARNAAVERDGANVVVQF